MWPERTGRAVQVRCKRTAGLAQAIEPKAEKPNLRDPQLRPNGHELVRKELSDMDQVGRDRAGE